MNIDEQTRDALSSIEWDGEAAKLTGQLDRTTYTKVNKVLESLGGKWNRKAKAHLFDAEAREALEAIVNAGKFVDPKKELQFFETPDALADEVVRLAGIDVEQRNVRILEPSAGSGQLIRAMRRYGVDAVFAAIQAVEIDGKHSALLKKTGSYVLNTDFLTVEPQYWAPFDYVIANPPFAKQADIDHVLHAWDFLKPGGRLVAIMSPGWTYRTNKKSVAFKDFVYSNEMYWHMNDAGAFKSSGTMVNTLTLRVDKP